MNKYSIHFKLHDHNSSEHQLTVNLIEKRLRDVFKNYNIKVDDEFTQGYNITIPENKSHKEIIDAINSTLSKYLIINDNPVGYELNIHIGHKQIHA